MKKLLFSVMISVLSLSAIAQTHLYENPDFEKIAKDHHVIAILPFDATVSLRPKQMKDTSPEQLDRMEQSEGESVQSAMYSWFLKREKRGQLTVKVQDTNKTNAILTKNGISYDKLTQYTPEELAKILEVDAVVSGKFETSKPMSDGASLVLGALVGFWGSTNKAVMNMFIHNASDGQLLINYNKGLSGSLGSSTEDLINVLMRKASRRIAYTEKG